MNKKIYTIIILLTIFVVLYKNSDVKGFRRFLISFKLAVIITFTMVSPANAKDNGFLPGAEGFTPPISRSAPKNSGYFGSKTTSSRKKGPNGSSNIDAKPKFPHQINFLLLEKNNQFKLIWIRNMRNFNSQCILIRNVLEKDLKSYVETQKQGK